jgi:ketopantoate reductase
MWTKSTRRRGPAKEHALVARVPHTSLHQSKQHGRLHDKQLKTIAGTPTRASNPARHTCLVDPSMCAQALEQDKRAAQQAPAHARVHQTELYRRVRKHLSNHACCYMTRVCETSVGTCMRDSNTADRMVRTHHSRTRVLLCDTRVHNTRRHTHAWLKHGL